jgi:hypothetical protein
MQTLRDALQVNETVKDLDLQNLSATCFATIARGIVVRKNIKYLTLKEIDISGEEDLISFVAALRSVMPFLEELVLERSNIGDQVAVALADMLKECSCSCRRLELYDCHIGVYGAVRLGDALGTNTSLEELNLELNEIGNVGGIAIALGLAGNKSLRILHLDHCGMTGGDVAAAFALLLKRKTQLEELHLCEAAIGNVGALSIANSLLEHQTLRVLNLSHCGIRPRGAAAVGRLLGTNATIQDLDLSGNDIGDTGCTALVDCLLGNQSIKSIRLDNCRIQREGAALFGKLLGTNATIEELSLAQNNIGDEGCVALVDGLRNNSSLQRLQLWDCRVGNVGAVALGHVLKTNNILSEVSFGSLLEHSNGDIGLEGFTSLADGLSCNTTLLRLSMYGIPPPPPCLAKRIEGYIQANRFRHLYLQLGPNERIPSFLWPLMLAHVSEHAAVASLVLGENLDVLLESGT